MIHGRIQYHQDADAYAIYLQNKYSNLLNLNELSDDIHSKPSISSEKVEDQKQKY
jgi:hypothetical protein